MSNCTFSPLFILAYKLDALKRKPSRNVMRNKFLVKRLYLLNWAKTSSDIEDIKKCYLIF